MTEIVRYKDPAEREPDTQYRDLLKHILDKGVEVHPIQGEAAKSVLGAQLRFDMSNGFPAITERDVSGPLLRAGIGEHIAFLNGARTQEQLEAFGVTWWDRWLTAEQCAYFDLDPGDMGDGSYGAAWTSFPTAEGDPFDQIEHLVRQIKERPGLRTHRITNWIPQYVLQHSGLVRNVVVAPCHGDVHVLVYPETNELSVHHVQRSGDIPVGVVFNFMQYAAFGMMLAQQTGRSFKELVFTISDAHIYESQYGHVEELLSREPRALGTVSLVGSGSIENIKDYRTANFELTDYNPHPKMFIPTPV